MARFGGVLVEEEEPKKSRFGGVPVEDTEPRKKPETGVMDRLQLGLSDAMSTMAGDTYGAYGDEPTQRSKLPLSMRITRAMGSDIVPAVGSAVVQGVTEVTPQPVKQGLTQAMQWAGRNVPEPVKAGARQIGEAFDTGVEALDRTIPGAPEAIGETVSAFAPALRRGGGMIRRSEIAKNNAALRRAVESERFSDIRKRLEPANIEDPATRNFGDTIVEEGRLNTKRLVPGERSRRIDAEVAAIEDFNPRGSGRQNITAIERRVDQLRNDLDQDLVDAADIRVADVAKDINAAVDDASNVVLLASDSANNAAGRIYRKFSQIVSEYENNGAISTGDLLNARRDLDNWIKQSSSSAFSPDVMNGTAVATKTLRDAINNRVANAAPSVAVKESLQRQSDLLTARDGLIPRAMQEGRSGLSRAVTKVEGDTGLRPATTPLAFTANVSSIPAMVITGTATLASLAGRGAVRAGRRLKTSALNNIAAAKEAGNAAAIAAIVSADDSYEEE